MNYLLLLCTLFASAEDSCAGLNATRQKNYSQEIMFNTVLGFGFTFGVGFFHTKGNDAYADYKESRTVSAALEHWRTVQLYDTIRNVCAVGAIIFLTRAVYYQFRHMKEPASQFKPIVDIQYALNPKIIAGITVNL